MSKGSVKEVKIQCRNRITRRDFRGYKQVPWLSVSGVWLEDHGFGIGSKVSVTVRQGELIIRAIV